MSGLAVTEQRQAMEALEHFNESHADTVLFFAQFAVGADDAVDALAVAVDAEGLDLDVRRRVGADIERIRWPFPEPVSSSDEISGHVFGALMTARERVGERVPITSLEAEMVSTRTLRTYPGIVSSTRRRTPNLIEVTVEGLGDMPLGGGDEFTYLFVDQPGADPLPDDYDMATYLETPDDERPWGAYYTVRTSDTAAGTVTYWLVDHGGDAGVGAWSRHAAPGDRVFAWGPRAGAPNPPVEHAVLLAVDESGFAAAAALIDQLPEGAHAVILAETIDAEHTIDFGPRASVTWLFRGDTEPGTGGLLSDAVRTIELSTERPWWFFGAGESREITSIRKYLRRDLGYPATHVHMVGYWRR